MECVEKISPVRLQEVDKLHTILDRVQLALAQPAAATAGLRTPSVNCIENRPPTADQPPNNSYRNQPAAQRQNIFRYYSARLK